MSAEIILDFINSHKSVRNFKPDPITAEDLDKIFKAGIRASSAGNMQSWCVIVSKDEKIKSHLMEIHRRQKMVTEAPAVLTFCSDFNRMRRWIDLSGSGDPQSFDDLLGFLTGAVDATIAAQNMVLAAEAIGLGACYMGTTLWAMEEIGKILELPRFVVPVTSVVIGYPKEENKELVGRLPLELIVHQEKYRQVGEKEFLSLHASKENEMQKRQEKNLNVQAMKKLGKIKSTVGVYTSELKYSKKLHIESSERILSYLKAQGFWNHELP